VIRLKIENKEELRNFSAKMKKEIKNDDTEDITTSTSEKDALKDKPESSKNNVKNSKQKETEEMNEDYKNKKKNVHSATVKKGPYDGVRQQLDGMKKENYDDDESEKKINKKKVTEKRIPKTSTKNDKQEKVNGGDGCGMLLAIVVMLVGMGLIYATKYGLLRIIISNKHSYNTVEDFQSAIDKISNEFKDQPQTTIKLFKNVGIEHLKRVQEENKDDLRPMSFLLAGYQGSEKTLDCFMKKLAKAFTNKPYEIIESTEYKNKERLDEKIKSSLQNDQKFIIVQNVDKLPFSTAQLFMSYSDAYNDLSSFPQSLIILTTILPFKYDPVNSSRKLDEGRVGDYFKNVIWKGQGPADSIPPLWTRVGDGLALLRHNDKNVCSIQEDL